MREVPNVNYVEWAKSHMDSVLSALDRPWVLNIDATIKPLYGHQEGAQIG